LFASNKTKVEENIVHIEDLNDPILDELAGQYANELRQDVELISNVYDPFDVAAYKAGKLAPVFFGSAMNNFGVRELLEKFIEIAPTPRSRDTETREVDPTETKFSGFVFKIHANIDPRHRDRIAFLRVCSGKFERNKFYKHVRLAKEFKYPNPVTFMAQAKSTIDEAYPGDVVGLYDTGNFKIGDTLTEGENMMFKGIPSFSPEIFKELVNRDPMKTKQLDKGIRQLTEEGVAQVFFQEPGSRKIVGTVGELQFEVIKYRLENEYGAKCIFEPKSYYKACWITTTDPAKLAEFLRIKGNNIVKDKEDRDVFLAPSQFMLDMEKQNYPELSFHFTSELDA
jgi:peptide chain release factor 3